MPHWAIVSRGGREGATPLVEPDRGVAREPSADLRGTDAKRMLRRVLEARPNRAVRAVPNKK